MAFTPSVSLTNAARADASRSVSKWRWTLFGMILSIVPIVNIILISISTIVLSVLTPPIDLSTSKRQALYFQNPARYTAEYRRNSKKVTVPANFLWMACGNHYFKSLLKER